jgi:hypothetical protein
LHPCRFCAFDEVQLKVLEKACSLQSDGLQLGWSKGDECLESARGEVQESRLDRRVRNLKDVELREDFQKGVRDVGGESAEGRDRGSRAGLAGFVEGIVEKSKAEEVGKGERGGDGKLEIVKGEVFEGCRKRKGWRGDSSHHYRTR